MSSQSTVRNLVACIAVVLLSAACSSDDIASEREELMEGVRDAAKPLGAMLKGERDFDAGTMQESLAVFSAAADKLGSLVPDGSQGGEAAPAIWDDPEGFAATINAWQVDIAAAVNAAPQTMEDAGPVIKSVMGNCKSCHDDYRIEDD